MICVLVILMSVYHDDVSLPLQRGNLELIQDKIVNWMKPAANWMKK